MRGFSKAAALLGAMALSISAASAQTLIPGGFTVGVAVSTRGAVVAGASDVAGAPGPARLAGLRPGDVITEIDGFPVESAADLARELSRTRTPNLYPPVCRSKAGVTCTRRISPFLW